MKAKTADFEDILLQPGLYPFRLCQIIDIGTQKSNFDPAGNPQLIWVLEFPTVLHTFSQDKGPEPLVKYRWFGNSLGPKSKMKEAIQGLLGRNIDKDFPLDTLIPTVGQIMVGVEPKTDGSGWKQKFLAFMPATPQILAMDLPMLLDHFVFDMDNFNPEVFNAMSKGIQDIVTASKEYAAAISSGVIPPVRGGQPAPPQFVSQAAAPQWQPGPAQTTAPAQQPQWTPPGQPQQPAVQPSHYPQPTPYQQGQAPGLPWEQPRPPQQQGPPGYQLGTPGVQQGPPPQTPPPSQWMSPPAGGVPADQSMQPGQSGQAAVFMQPETPKKRGGKKIG